MSITYCVGNTAEAPAERSGKTEIDEYRQVGTQACVYVGARGCTVDRQNEGVRGASRVTGLYGRRKRVPLSGVWPDALNPKP